MTLNYSTWLLVLIFLFISSFDYSFAAETQRDSHKSTSSFEIDEISSLSKESFEICSCEAKKHLQDQINSTRQNIHQIIKANESRAADSLPSQLDSLANDSHSAASFPSNNTRLETPNLQTDPKQGDQYHESSTEFVEEESFPNDEDHLYLEEDEQRQLIERVKSISRADIDKSILSLVAEPLQNPKIFLQSPVDYQIEIGVILARYFHSKHNFKRELNNLVGVLKCNLSFQTETKSVPVQNTRTGKTGKNTKQVTENVVLIERSRPLTRDSRFQFKFETVQHFKRSFDWFCTEINHFLEPLKQVFADFKKDGLASVDRKDPTSFLGAKIEGKLRQHEGTFKKISESGFSASEHLMLLIGNIDCDLKDMMAFYDLLPRFFLLYRRMKPKLESYEDPVVGFYGEKLVEIHSRWLKANNDLFRLIGGFDVWLVLTQSLFRLPFSFSRGNRFKVSMIEAVSKTFMEFTLEKDNYRTAIKLILQVYREIYEDLKVFFEGVEEYLFIKVPFRFSKLAFSGRLLGGLVLILGLLVWRLED